MNECDSFFPVQEARSRHFTATWGTLVRLRGAPPTLEETAALATERLGGLPALRLTSPDPAGRRPRWHLGPPANAPRNVAAVATGAGHGSLRRTVGALLAERIPADTPPWRLDLLTGYSGEEFGVLLRCNHALCDGVSGGLLLRRLLSPAPPARPLAPGRPVPAPGPVRTLLPVLPRLIRAAGPLGIDVAPSPGRHVAWVHVPREVAEEARGPMPGLSRPTLNDVYLAAVAGALRRVSARPSRPAFALVPVDIRRPGDATAIGNCVSAVRVPLPVHLPGPAHRLAAVHAATSRVKREGQARALIHAARAADRAGARARSLLSRYVYSTRYANLVCSNLPITLEPLELAGRPVLDMATATVLPDRHGLALLLHGYGGTVTVTVLASAGLADRADLFAKELEQEFHLLARTPRPM